MYVIISDIDYAQKQGVESYGIIIKYSLSGSVIRGDG